MCRGARYISDHFLDVLKKDESIIGLISSFKKDIDLCFELRDEKPAIYYRGKKMFDIKLDGNKVLFYFNESVQPKESEITVDLVVNACTVQKRINDYKELVDRRLNEIHRKYPEGKFQYRLAHCNGMCHKEEDEFLIVDIEYYQENKNNWHFDLVALNTKEQPFFSFIEVKHGESSLRTKEGKDGNPGIRKHLYDFKRISESEETMKRMKEDLEKVTSQKVELGLINLKQPFCINHEKKPEFIFVLFNYNIKSKQLRNELDEIYKDYEKMYSSCKDQTFFAFINSNDDFERYILNRDNLISFEDTMRLYSSYKKI